MAMERLGMRSIHEVFRLGWAEKKSLRQVGKSVGISPSTVHGYFSKAIDAGLTTWEKIIVLDETVLEARLFPPPKIVSVASGSKKHLQPNWEEIHLEMRRPGVTLELLWQEYRKDSPEGLGRSQFSE